jgi:hypothetical protein
MRIRIWKMHWRGAEMMTGNFSAELNEQRISRLQLEANSHRSAHQAVQDRRRHRKLSRPAALIYRMAVRAVALGLLFVVVTATSALALRPGPDVVQSSTKSAGQVAHVRELVGPDPTSPWVPVVVLAAVVMLIVVLGRRGRSATA